MTIPSSSVPGAIGAILSAITTAAAGDRSTMTICLGVPGTNVDDDIIWIDGEVARSLPVESMIGSFGAQALREVYDLTINVSSFADSDDLTVMTRAYQLAAYVESAVRSNPTLGGLVELCVPTGSTGGQPQPVQEPAGVQCELVIKVHIEQTL